MLRLLLYADYLALLASTKHRLQNMLRVLADFFLFLHMTWE
jgi:hypothetical protein